MLLAEEPYTVENLAGSRASSFKALAKVRVLPFEPFDSLGSDLAGSTRPFHRFHAGFGLKRPAAEAGELVAQVADELLKLPKCFYFRTIAVGFQVCSRVR